MAKINIKEIVTEILAGTEVLAKTLFKGYVTAALADAQAFLQATEVKLKNWSFALSHGDLSKAEFVSLVNGQKELMELKSLKQAGLLQIKLDEFKDGVTKLITTSIFKLIGL